MSETCISLSEVICTRDVQNGFFKFGLVSVRFYEKPSVRFQFGFEKERWFGFLSRSVVLFCCVSLDVISDTRKTVCMTLRPVSRDRWITGDFTAFTLDGWMQTQFCVSV